jgi:hypothetical protein
MRWRNRVLNFEVNDGQNCHFIIHTESFDLVKLNFIRKNTLISSDRTEN